MLESADIEAFGCKKSFFFVLWGGRHASIEPVNDDDIIYKTTASWAMGPFHINCSVWNGWQRTHIGSILGRHVYQVYSVYSTHGALTTFFNSFFQHMILSHHRLFNNPMPISICQPFLIIDHLRWSISTKLIRMDHSPVKHGWIFRIHQSLHPKLISPCLAIASRPRRT